MSRQALLYFHYDIEMKQSLRQGVDTWMTGIVLALFIVLFLFQLFLIHRYAVNIPYLDDWGMLGFGRPALSVKWLRSYNNDHNIATTKLFVWLQFHLNGWNYRVHLVLNYLIYGVLLLWIAWFVHKAAPHLSAWVICGFMIFLLSPINWFNHFMGDQSCFHFAVLFSFIGAYYFFTTRQSWIDLMVGCVMSILAIYSLASGVVSIIVVLITFALFKGVRVKSASSRKQQVHEIIQLASVVLIVGAFLSLWTVDYVHGPDTRVTLPDTSIFWAFFLNMVAFGFGIDRPSSVLGAICLLLVLFPMCAKAWRQKGKLEHTQWVSLVLVLGTFATIAQISLGRAAFGVETWSKTSRYVEFVMPLIPLSVVNWAVLLRRHKRLEAFALGGLFLLCGVAFSNNWSFSAYQREAAIRLEGRECVKAYYEGVGDGRCPMIYPSASITPLSTRLDAAKTLNVSFYREIHREMEQGR